MTNNLIGKITQEDVSQAFASETIDQIRQWWNEAITEDERTDVIRYAAAMLNAHTMASRALSCAVNSGWCDDPGHNRINKLEALHDKAAEAFFELLFGLHVDDPHSNGHYVRWQALISWAAESGCAEDAARVLFDDEHSILAQAIRNRNVHAASAADRRE